jgi:tRNA/rRNA methyltransferase
VNNTEALKNIRIVLTRPSHPGNIGAAARAMKTMGLSDLWLVSPLQFPHGEARARAASARDVLEQAHVVDTLAAALEGCVLAIATSARHRELRHDVMDVRGAAREALAAATRPVAIVFGNEAAGLSADEAVRCAIWAHVPTSPDCTSLNLGAAVQVFSYELRMACAVAEVAPPAEFETATLDQIELLYEHFRTSMTTSGFYDPAKSGRLLQRMRRLLARTRLEAEEVNILRGFLKSLEKPRRT